MNVLIKVDDKRIFLDKISYYYQEGDYVVINLVDFNKVKTNSFTLEEFDAFLATFNTLFESKSEDEDGEEE